MKWITKLPVPTPPDGKIGSHKHFTWLPRECSDGTTRWLETVTEVVRFDGPCDGWVIVRFDSKDTR